MVISLILAVVIVIIDQVTKFLFYGMSQSLIGDFLWLESTLNTGASFGMMQNSTVLFIIMTIPVILAIIYVIFSKKYLNKFNKICLGIVLGGAVGNLIDRFFFGGVRDFIYFKSINFAIFNFADMAVTIGVIMFIVGLIVQIFKNKKQESVAASKPSDEKPENPERLEALKDLRDTLKDASQSYENPENDDDGGEAD